MNREDQIGHSAETLGRRRRRRAGSPASGVPNDRPGADDAAAATGGKSSQVTRLRGWRMPELLSSWGLSPTFRVFIFLSGIVGVMAFLLYNEYVIAELKEHERGRAELYARVWGLAISNKLPDEDAVFIFEKVIDDPKVNIPVIVTDAKGDITNWKATGGLPELNDSSAAAQQRLREALVRMDAVNEPYRWIDQAEINTRLYHDAGDVLVVDTSMKPLFWAGKSLPRYDDTSPTVATEIADMLVGLAEREVVFRPIKLPTSTTIYFYRDVDRFAMADRDGRPLAWGGSRLPSASDSSQSALEDAKLAMQEMAQRNAPETFSIRTEQYFHYGDSELISSIEVAPFVTVGVLLLFGFIGYVGLRNIRRSEQRTIWVGMAKETAHQLGTPLSSLSGWLELITRRLDSERTMAPAATGSAIQGRGKNEGNTPGISAVAHDQGEAIGSVESIVREMQKDMGRLNQIAQRFSQIGSVPELKAGPVQDVIAETVNYFRSRGPQFGRHVFNMETQEVPNILHNYELMGWAFENLFKNAMDAIGQKDGVIDVRVEEARDEPAVKISIRDNGRGIGGDHANRVFEPGFSTKKRGWGLGLAFVKRIVEEYHGGRIQIAHTALGEGTTFEIFLPKQK